MQTQLIIRNRNTYFRMIVKRTSIESANSFSFSLSYSLNLFQLKSIYLSHYSRLKYAHECGLHRNRQLMSKVFENVYIFQQTPTNVDGKRMGDRAREQESQSDVAILGQNVCVCNVMFIVHCSSQIAHCTLVTLCNRFHSCGSESESEKESHSILYGRETNAL